MKALVRVTTLNKRRQYKEKYKAQYRSLILKPATAHPRWLIDENDKIFRAEVWESPPTAPAKADSTATNNRGSIIRFIFASKQFKSRAEGATFCHARTINTFLQERPSTTWGSHKWKGAAAIFISNPKKIKIEVAE